jgi:hypothetical protein
VDSFFTYLTDNTLLCPFSSKNNAKSGGDDTQGFISTTFFVEVIKHLFCLFLAYSNVCANLENIDGFWCIKWYMNFVN